MYDYTVIDADGYRFALRRMLLYIALLFVIVATALVVIFILFEIYFWLFLSAGLYVIAFLAALLIGRRNTAFRYSFDAAGVLHLTSRKGKTAELRLNELVFEKDAELSDLTGKDADTYCFTSSRIRFRPQDDVTAKYQISVFTYNGKRVVLLLDDYARSLLERSNG